MLASHQPYRWTNESLGRGAGARSPKENKGAHKPRNNSLLACFHGSKRHMLTYWVTMPRSHQTFRSVLAVKLLGIMLRNR